MPYNAQQLQVMVDVADLKLRLVDDAIARIGAHQNVLLMAIRKIDVYNFDTGLMLPYWHPEAPRAAERAELTNELIDIGKEEQNLLSKHRRLMNTYLRYSNANTFLINRVAPAEPMTRRQLKASLKLIGYQYMPSWALEKWGTMGWPQSIC